MSPGSTNTHFTACSTGSLKLGTDTFKGAGSSGLRNAFFGKTLGEVELQRDLLTVHSPISGGSLTAPDIARHGALKDPISGTTLVLGNGHAELTAPVLRQEQVHARNFYLRNDIDVQIALLRKTNKINRFTNEKIGTAGHPTGLDKALLTGSRLRCSEAKQKQQQQQ